MKSISDLLPVRERKFREVSFVYQDKPALRLIRDKTKDNLKAGANLLALYYALTWVASDRGISSFEATWQELEKYSRISKRTLQRYVRDLERWGLVKIERRSCGKQKLPNKFTLLSIKGLVPHPYEDLMDPQHWYFLNSPDKEIIENLESILESRAKKDALACDIETLIAREKLRPSPRMSFVRKLICIDNIIDKMDCLDYLKGVSIARARGRVNSLSYLKGILWQAFRS